MSFFSDLMSTVFERRYDRSRSQGNMRGTIEELSEALMSSSGEVSGMSLAHQILDHYAALDDAGKGTFFKYLADKMGIDPEAVRTTLEAFELDPGKSTYRAFLAASEARRQELARRLNQVPGATGQLVEMRKDLLRLSRSAPELSVIDLDFRHLLTSWFNRGFLVLRRINWESPAEILEKIIAYEAVHEIGSWDELRLRVQPEDRRCFAFFHPTMPNEPLIFVEVALTRGVPSSVQGLLSETREHVNAEDADTAVFYSISNCQEGLAGISFGNSLIKQVVADLSRELPGLSTFVTLSPIPGLNKWAAETGNDLPTETPEQQRQRAAFYLLDAKRKDGFPYDPVARFHLGNGARVHAVHADADISDNGLAQSNGVMVNYLYDLNLISQNHEGYAGKQTIAASSEVTGLMRAAQKQTA